MTHHCKPRDVTLGVAAAYELDAGELAFLTGSGEDTNKVQSIVEDATDLRESAAVDASQGAFEGSIPEDAGTTAAGSSGSSTDATTEDGADGTVATDSESQSTLADSAEDDADSADDVEPEADAEADDDQSGLNEFF